MNKHILVVEDDASIVEVITIILTDNGYTVDTATDTKTMQQKMRQRTPILILLDIWVAGEDGKELAHGLKRKEETKDIPIIMISAHAKAQTIAKDAGVDAFLAKPFDMKDLLKLVEKFSRPQEPT